MNADVYFPKNEVQKREESHIRYGSPTKPEHFGNKYAYQCVPAVDLRPVNTQTNRNDAGIGERKRKYVLDPKGRSRNDLSSHR